MTKMFVDKLWIAASYQVLSSFFFFLNSYTALKSSRLLEDMAMRGVKYVDCYGVDNALVRNSPTMKSHFSCFPFFHGLTSRGQVRVADPTFLGYFIDKGVAAAAKVVRKVKYFLYISFWRPFSA